MKLRAKAGDGRMMEVSLLPEMIERVIEEWEQEHPGRNATVDMDGDEFARRLMIEVHASLRMVP
jgi:hypothetical protein